MMLGRIRRRRMKKRRRKKKEKQQSLRSLEQVANEARDEHVMVKKVLPCDRE